VKIACVLKPGGDYDTDYIDHFLSGLQKHSASYEFMLLGNSGWPGWWSKMELFRPSVKGDLLYFDLDTMIVGQLDELMTVNTVTVLSDFNIPNRMASGVMFIPEIEREPIWREWIKDPEGHIKRWHGHGDGGFLSQFWGGVDRWQDKFPGQVVSYKNHCVPIRGVPDNARVVCFHGRPRPRDVRWKI
jgi:hypothetical protein